MIDNVDVAILTKLNQLAERRGLKPYDFVATVQRHETKNAHVLCFEVPASGNALREERFTKMLRDIGIAEGDSSDFIGSPADIIDALDSALQLSPRQPGRHQ